MRMRAVYVVNGLIMFVTRMQMAVTVVVMHVLVRVSLSRSCWTKRPVGGVDPELWWNQSCFWPFRYRAVVAGSICRILKLHCVDRRQSPPGSLISSLVVWTEIEGVSPMAAQVVAQNMGRSRPSLSSSVRGTMRTIVDGGVSVVGSFSVDCMLGP